MTLNFWQESIFCWKFASYQWQLGQLYYDRPRAALVCSDLLGFESQSASEMMAATAFTRSLSWCKSVYPRLYRNTKLMNHKRKCTELSSPLIAARTVTHHSFPYPDIPNTEAAKTFVVNLDDHGRSLLYKELHRVEQLENKSGEFAQCVIFVAVIVSCLSGPQGRMGRLFTLVDDAWYASIIAHNTPPPVLTVATGDVMRTVCVETRCHLACVSVFSCQN